MLEIFQKMVALLKADTQLTAIVPADNIAVGPVDITMEKQKDLRYPQINIFQVSEVQRSNPLNCRDTRVQLDIWSRDSQLQLEQIYERIIPTLSYLIADQGSAHIFWQRLDGGIDQYETDRRIWHRAVTYMVWSVK